MRSLVWIVEHHVHTITAVWLGFVWSDALPVHPSLSLTSYETDDALFLFVFYSILNYPAAHEADQMSVTVRISAIGSRGII